MLKLSVVSFDTSILYNGVSQNNAVETGVTVENETWIKFIKVIRHL
jgi:3-deoxy-D-manno-octulosonic-acid transferase